MLGNGEGRADCCQAEGVCYNPGHVERRRHILYPQTRGKRLPFREEYVAALRSRDHAGCEKAMESSVQTRRAPVILSPGVGVGIGEASPWATGWR